MDPAPGGAVSGAIPRVVEREDELLGARGEFRDLHVDPAFGELFVIHPVDPLVCDGVQEIHAFMAERRHLLELPVCPGHDGDPGLPDVPFPYPDECRALRVEGNQPHTDLHGGGIVGLLACEDGEVPFMECHIVLRSLPAGQDLVLPDEDSPQAREVEEAPVRVGSEPDFQRQCVACLIHSRCLSEAYG